MSIHQTKADRVWALVICTIAVILLSLVGNAFFAGMLLSLNEDTGLLLFFLGLPTLVGLSFVSIIAVYRYFTQGVLPRYALRTAGLLAASVTGVQLVVIPRLVLLMRTSLSVGFLHIVEGAMVGAIWASALLMSAGLFTLLIRRRLPAGNV